MLSNQPRVDWKFSLGVIIERKRPKMAIKPLYPAFWQGRARRARLERRPAVRDLRQVHRASGGALYE